ncbi:TonB-dependent receptor domain-containing protein [Ottowia sp.]|uniref:TonB-dependent receptor domain-containing protein n=1 Tax=Ottowia sp. TaxID=1898956 RepID=UPI003A8A9DB5
MPRVPADRLKPLTAAVLGLLCLPVLAQQTQEAQEAQAPEQAAVQSLETVVVTASGHEQNIADAPASISVISRENLDVQSYSTIVDAVKNIPGVYVTGGGATQDISVRGMTQSYTLYLVDGRPISAGRSVNTNGTDSGKQIGLPPLSMVERIEVIRGPMSSLYGSEAMGGVINIITRKTGGKWQGSVGAEYTKSFNDVSNDGQSANFFVGGPLVAGLLGLRVNGAYLGADESDYWGGGLGSNTGSRPKTRQKSGGLELVFTPNEANRFTMSYQTSRQDTTMTPGKSVETTTTGLPSTTRYDKDIYTLTHDGRYGDLRLNTYLQHDVSDRVQDLVKKEKMTTLNTQGFFPWKGHVLTFGGQYRKEKLTDLTNGLLTSGIAGAESQMNRWIAALFAEVDWTLTSQLSLTTGLRYNHDEMFGGHLSPRVYGVYRHTPQWTLKGGVSTGYRQPSLSQATAGFGRGTGGGGSPAPHPRALIIGNPDLDPEKSTNFEAGYAYDSQRGFKTSMMVFHTQYKDKIAEDRYCESPNGDRNDPSSWVCPFGGNNYYFLSTSKNIAKAILQGVELTLDYQFTRTLNLSSSYTFTHSEQKTGAFVGKPLNKQPKHMLNAMLQWQATPQLLAWVQGNFRGKTSDYLGRTTMSSGTPSYGFVDIGVAYKVTPTVQLKAGVYNVFDKTVTNDTYGVVLDGLRATVGLTADF